MFTSLDTNNKVRALSGKVDLPKSKFDVSSKKSSIKPQSFLNFKLKKVSNRKPASPVKPTSFLNNLRLQNKKKKIFEFLERQQSK